MVRPSFSQARGRGGAPVRSRAGRDSPWRRLSAAQAAAPTAPGRTRSTPSPAAASFRTVGSPSREPAAPASPEPRARLGIQLGIRLGILRPHFRLGLRVTVRAGSAARKPPPRKRFRVHKAHRGRGPRTARKSGGWGDLPGQELANPAPPGSKPCGPSPAGRGSPIPGNCGGRECAVGRPGQERPSQERPSVRRSEAHRRWRLEARPLSFRTNLRSVRLQDSAPCLAPKSSCELSTRVWLPLGADSLGTVQGWEVGHGRRTALGASPAHDSWRWGIQAPSSWEAVPI